MNTHVGDFCVARQGTSAVPLTRLSVGSISSRLSGKRVAMVMFSTYPSDPRPRRAADAFIKEGATVDLICLAHDGAPKRETLCGLDVRRVSIRHRRGGKVAYVYQYSAFLLISTIILCLRCVRRRYDLVHVHNMPDVLVLSALIPKLLGAKVILDQHDPMPELMTTIFGLDESSFDVRFIKRLEKWSLARAHLVLTVNLACKRIFAERSCPPQKIGVVMNSPDERIFPFRSPRSYARSNHASNKPFVIMYHGSLVERNGLDLAVTALGRVRKTVPCAELQIFGHRTPFLESVLRRTADLGLQDKVRYLGPRRLEELVPLIETCDVGIIPNQRNRFTDVNTPTRIFEYLALGKPVIAPRTRGIQDYFDPGTLLFFEPGDADNLAQTVEHVFFHPVEAVESAERGQQVYLTHTWSREREALVNFTSELLNGGQAI